MLLVESQSVMTGDPIAVGQDTGTPSVSASTRPLRLLVETMDAATAEVYAAIGINPAVFRPSDGSGMREARRQVLFGVVAPLGRAVQSEPRRELDAPGLVLTWDELRASDLSGRARAFQSMVGGGMDVAKAASLAGLMEPEE